MRCRKTNRMSKSDKITFKIIVGLTILLTTLFSFIIHLKPNNFNNLQNRYSIFSAWRNAEIPNISQEPVKIDQQISEMLNHVNRSMPNVDFTYLNQTTSANNSTATIVNYKPIYCVGDNVTVRVDMYNYLGEKKTYGGDFLRARIFSPNLVAGASGKIEDFHNGTYNVYFTLFWKGQVKISILLIHPSEGVSALWKARNHQYNYISYTGLFLNNSNTVSTRCDFSLDEKGEKCEYVDKRYGESFYCMRPSGVACEAFISLKSGNKPYTSFTDEQKKLFMRSFTYGVEIPKLIESVNVLECPACPMKVSTSACQTGMFPPFPSGYFLNNQWFPIYCNLTTYNPIYNIKTCLAGKMIYLMGDSTIRQWIEYIPKIMKTYLLYNNHGIGRHKTILGYDFTNQIYIQWKKHGHPFVTQSFFNMKDHSYITNEIDLIGGGAYTIIVISVGQHFRPFPLDLFIRRVLNIRKAIENLFLRSPDTKVIIKSENTREMNGDVERFSDFHGYIQYLLVKDIFRGLNVGVIDAWDMTTAYGSYSVHPPEEVIKNQINLFLSYIC
ncbi:NXPE family member 1-like isoform X2 [Hyla sarda]|uniref:NXPE family member 1-like isoform X2 n=2 Tax=Hyla sarda TaxID=327740 RepID=UPI0024C28A12|nr:NXPE family member 1-like isoform X2 [Hyla sarda]